jgi:hypothetical protein
MFVARAFLRLGVWRLPNREKASRISILRARVIGIHARRFSLAVTPTRLQLGVLRAETWARTAPRRTDRNKRHMRADPGRESLRWGRAVQACDTQLALETRAIRQRRLARRAARGGGRRPERC